MSTIRANLRNTHTFVTERAEFRGASMAGRHARVGFGQLPERYRAAFLTAQLAGDFYVVQSYDTPIAWFALGAWFVPNVRYSNATVRHQSALRLVHDGSVWRTDAMWARNDDNRRAR